MRRYIFCLFSLMYSLLAGCTPDLQDSAHLQVRFLTQLPPSPSQADLDQVTLPSSEGITFYSAQNPNVERQPFSYITAITSEAREYKDSVNLLPQANYPVLASNIDFGLKQSETGVYAYNRYKGRADALIRWYGNTRVAYLALINPYHDQTDSLQEQDLELLRNSVDRLQIKGIKNIILLSQYPASVSPDLLQAIQGIDVVISTGEHSQTQLAKNVCMAQFSQNRTDNLALVFDARGHLTQCRFHPSGSAT
ncbi:hypothetical protein [Photobacterium salinisoli]|uniref:hypothetical protein n=1 Tax=Photobacterium salinisoli TaxID=1616783 RepID=UPI000EA27542|nr:hypothetical protein [Photobacterium salinisoli]